MNLAILKGAVFIPIVGACLVPFLKNRRQLQNICALFLTFLTFVSIAALIPSVLRGNVITYTWPFPLDLNLVLSADILSVFIAEIFAFVTIIVFYYSGGYVSRYKYQSEYYSISLLLLASAMGLIFSMNLLWIYIFWELLVLCAWKLTGFFRNARDLSAANKTIMLNVFGAVFMLMGLIMIYFDKGTLDLRILRGETISTISAFFILVGIFAKSAIFPFSSWFLEAAAAAPSSSCALLCAAIGAKAGVYVYARIFGVSIIPSSFFSETVVFVTAASAVISAGAALIETNIKKILAYSAISQVSFIFLGLASGNSIAFIGAMLYTLMHSIAKAGMFLIAGTLEEKTQTADITRMGGLVRTMPISAVSFGLCSLSVMAIPPLGGFFGKFMIFTGATEYGNPWILGIFLLAAILTLLYLVRLFYLVFLGEKQENMPKEGYSGMVLSGAVLALTCMLLGLFVYYPATYIQAISSNLGVFIR